MIEGTSVQKAKSVYKLYSKNRWISAKYSARNLVKT